MSAAKPAMQGRRRVPRRRSGRPRQRGRRRSPACGGLRSVSALNRIVIARTALCKRLHDVELPLPTRFRMSHGHARIPPGESGSRAASRWRQPSDNSDHPGAADRGDGPRAIRQNCRVEPWTVRARGRCRRTIRGGASGLDPSSSPAPTGLMHSWGRPWDSRARAPTSGDIPPARDHGGSEGGA